MTSSAVRHGSGYSRHLRKLASAWPAMYERMKPRLMSVFSSLSPVSDSTSSSRPRVGGATVRKAKLQDAVNIFDLVNSLSGDGTLLRRSYAEICENVRDFKIAESESGVFLGCGALHL